jgi:hypothetical protein
MASGEIGPTAILLFCENNNKDDCNKKMVKKYFICRAAGFL